MHRAKLSTYVAWSEGTETPDTDCEFKPELQAPMAASVRRFENFKAYVAPNYSNFIVSGKIAAYCKSERILPPQQPIICENMSEHVFEKTDFCVTIFPFSPA